MSKETTAPEKKELELAHIKLIEEEKIDVKTLPTEIKQRMNGFNLAVTAYNKKPTEESYEKLQKTSVDIADMIQDWHEKDIQEETPEEKAVREKEEADTKAKAEEEEKKKKEEADLKAKVDEEEKKKKAEEEEKEKNTPKKKGIHPASLEAKVKEKISNNEISSADLYAIIGTDNLDTFNNVETIGSLKLRKVYLADRYRVA